MEVNLSKITFDTGNGKKTLSQCTDDEFRAFLQQNDISVLESDGEWSKVQREMVLNLMVSTMEELAMLDNVEVSEENDDEDKINIDN